LKKVSTQLRMAFKLNLFNYSHCVIYMYIIADRKPIYNCW